MRLKTALIGGFCAALAATAIATAGGATAVAVQTKPNVLVVMTDDQTRASMKFMKIVNRRLADRGASFARFYENFSLGGPARVAFLTGQYAHNHQIFDNASPGGYQKFHTLPPPNNEANSLPTWLQEAGYYTGLIGRYVNGYEHRGDDPPLVPPGWTEWQGATNPYTYYDYDQARNFYDGTLHTEAKSFHNGDAVSDYQTDRYVRQAESFINRRAPSDQPFFLWLAPLAPHVGRPDPNPNPPGNCGLNAKPAPRHAHAFDSEPLPKPPSFNEEDVSDKPLDIRQRPRLSTSEIEVIRSRYRCRIESLLAVDEGVDKLLNALKAKGELDDTFVIYTSDNGYYQGEHRIRYGKVLPYEEAVRMPLIVRGPGVPESVKVSDPAIDADLAPTIVDIAGGTAGRVVDGQSLLPALQNPSAETGRELLIKPTTYAAVHNGRYLYAEYETGEKELYDLAVDPYELQSLHADPAYAAIMAELAAKLDELRDCAGEGCR